MVRVPMDRVPRDRVPRARRCSSGGDIGRLLQVSAKESRKRKQSYVDGLEKRVKVCTAHNLQLQRKLTNLEQQNM